MFTEDCEVVVRRARFAHAHCARVLLFFISDAHVSFTVDWDMDIISQLEATKNEMAVLTTYLTDVQGSIDENGHSTRDTRPIMCNTAFEGGPQGMHLRHGSQPEKYPGIKHQPQLQPWFAAGYVFS
jgi:Glycosyltransferase (GlcNAc)